MSEHLPAHYLQKMFYARRPDGLQGHSSGDEAFGQVVRNASPHSVTAKCPPFPDKACARCHQHIERITNTMSSTQTSKLSGESCEVRVARKNGNGAAFGVSVSLCCQVLFSDTVKHEQQMATKCARACVRACEQCRRRRCCRCKRRRAISKNIGLDVQSGPGISTKSWGKTLT